ncbi:Pet127-domain-containing protein [Karstenula rhodostoma CBS 690.94]|uniref:Pet127-domain-containing protein n=1 Tax=Karstenula rhodostoma CBS 690.94 TaxID=1392251 RepID=A0A9P4PNL4_9PLEO|nr:Pet127-domain-containing protein [Karstenula rhodostoma CBS 690.94]
MRKEIDEIHKRNKQVLGDAPVRKPIAAEPPRKAPGGKSLKEALLGAKGAKEAKEGRRSQKTKLQVSEDDFAKLDIKHLNPEELDFQPVDYEIPPVPRLAYGLDRVLFNPGVYRLQDPRSRVYNFDPYLEKIMSVNEFNFSALSEYKTSSKDEELLALTKKMETKFTGSTSSMSGVLQHFHFLLSNFRPLNHNMLSQEFPKPTNKFSKITLGPSAIFLRKKDDLYAIDADKTFDQPNIMSWLGHSLEKLLTVERTEFERYRRSSGDAVPGEDESSRCYHYSKLGNFLMRSQLDAYDPRLPGKGIFDLKTRAVVSIRMNHQEYETGKGYQIRYDRGEWESYEREFYDMTRATMLKYSLQVRMGRMDGIFVAYHNVERIFGFQYLPIEDMDNVLHGQKDTCLGDQEFKMSISLLDELMQKATQQYPDQTLHLHFHTHQSQRGNPPFMYIFAEPVTEERADEIQNKNQAAHKAFERDIVGIIKDDPSLQAEWHEIQDQVDEELGGGDEVDIKEAETAGDVEAAAEESLEQSSEKTSEMADDSSPKKPKDSDAPDTPKGPLMGWTLAVRHRLNGEYVERPAKLTSEDSWTIEYHIRELNESDRWSLYEKVKKARDDLVGEARDSASNKSQLDGYRQLIQRYSDKGRAWREEQDALAAAVEPKVYEPLGPGSEKEKPSSG